jgi:prepilin-type N-terminal cleavage/methylation domain-containing protein
MTVRFLTAVGRRRTAFTLIEIMLVIAILGLVLGIAVPPLYQAVKKEPMRKALTGVSQACEMARAQAILQGNIVNLNFLPQERTFSVEGGGAVGAHPGASSSGGIADSIIIEMLDVNLNEFRDQESARVRFFPNGTCDELTLILRSSRNEWYKLTLEPTTGNVSVGDVR